VEGRSQADSGITSVKSTCHPCHYCSLPGKGMGSHRSWGNQPAAQGAPCTPKLQGLGEKTSPPALQAAGLEGREAAKHSPGQEQG